MECSDVLPVNDENLCIDCYVKLLSWQGKTCVKCKKTFKSNNQIEWLCNRCRPNCKGCNVKFSPVDKLDYLCGTCHFKASRGEGACSGCGNYSTSLDYLAHCERCRTKDIADVPELCVVCKKRMTFHGICDTCVETKIPCPECERPMDAKYYLCNVCMDNRSKIQHDASKS